MSLTRILRALSLSPKGSTLTGSAAPFSTRATQFGCMPWRKAVAQRESIVAPSSRIFPQNSSSLEAATPWWSLSLVRSVAFFLKDPMPRNVPQDKAAELIKLEQLRRQGGPHHPFRPPRKPLDGNPMLKGVVLKTLIKKPKKPNSANRKCVLVRLSNGKEAVAYVPGVGHNLQEHNVVLVRCGRLQDVPGVKLKCIRGKYDLAHVQKQGK